MSSTPEGKVKKKVKLILADEERWGYIWSYWPVPSGFGKSTLDCLGTYQGLSFAIETKAPGKKPTALQLLEIENLKRAGAEVFVIDGDCTTLELWLLNVRRFAGSSLS